jgi:hypothetical protein
MPWPFYTVAGRVMHYGRYGSGAEDERLFPLYIGYPTMVRGYDVYSFDPSECVPDDISECPAFDRLVGSRVAVANLEFCFPLLRPFGNQALYGPVPVEVALFADAGTAWNAGASLSGFNNGRGAVASQASRSVSTCLGSRLGSSTFLGRSSVRHAGGSSSSTSTQVSRRSDSRIRASPAASSVLRGGPFTFADDRQSRAIDHEIDGHLGGKTRQLDRKVLAPPRKRGVVGRFEVDVHQGQDRAHEALRLAQRQPEDEPERQRGLNRQI